MSPATAPFAIAAASLLALVALGAPLERWQPGLLVLAVIVALPHGALDADLLRRRFAPVGPGAHAAAGAGYAALAAAALLGWLLAPPVGLALFLIASAWHFGKGDALMRPTSVSRLARAERFVRGAIVIVVPLALWPAAVHPILAALGGERVTRASLAIADALHEPLLVVAALTVAALLHRGRRAAAERGAARSAALEIALLVALFSFVPPLIAFAAYFAALHAQRHLAELAHRLARPRLALLRAALPATLFTLALAGAFWWSLDGTGDERLWRTVFIGLAAVTVPHMAFERTFERAFGRRTDTARPRTRERPPVRPRPPPTGARP